MAVVSQHKFAKSLSVSVPYINKLIKTGKLPGVKGGVDLSDPTIQAFIAHKKSGEAKGSNQSGKAIETIVPSASRHELEKLKLIQQTKAIELQNQIRRGELISHDVVKSVFSKLFAIHNNEFLRTCDKLAPVIAGIVGSNDAKVIMKISSEIERENYRVLERIQNELRKHVEGIGDKSSIKKKRIDKKKAKK